VQSHGLPAKTLQGHPMYEFVPGPLKTGRAQGTEKTDKFASRLRSILCLQCFDAVGWVAGRASGL